MTTSGRIPADPAVAVRLFATDLDGTLLRTDGTLSARTAAALARAAAAEVEIVVVTGRPPRWLDAVPGVTGNPGIALCANGAVELDLATGRILAVRPLASSAVDEAMARLTALGLAFVFDVEEVDGHVVKLLARGEPGAAPADAVLPRAAAALRGVAEVTHSGGPVTLLECSAGGVTKGTALARHASGRGVPAAAVAAVGDMPNDVPMLQWAGRSYAVANAHPDVLAVVDEVVPSHEQDGVAVALEQLLAGRTASLSSGSADAHPG
ncbi:MAG: hydrolase [Actinomycetota bacterium]|nr:MAG: hydrolase [Actinomycetota bacterium]